MSSSTQIVIASGIHIRSPVMRYFFIARRLLPGGVPRYGRTSAPLPMASDFDSDLLSDFLSGFVSDFASGFVSVFVSLLSVPPLFAAGLAPLFLKSVAYQPLPFNWNPAALSILENVCLPHSGQSVRIGSLSFCRYSFWNPQEEQRYS